MALSRLYIPPQTTLYSLIPDILIIPVKQHIIPANLVIILHYLFSLQYNLMQIYNNVNELYRLTTKKKLSVLLMSILLKAFYCSIRLST